MNIDKWTSGAGYDQWMGRWSRLLAQEFLKWLDVSAGLRWIDVCCGSGMVTEAVVERTEGVKMFAVGHLADDEGITVEAEGVFVVPKWAR